MQHCAHFSELSNIVYNKVKTAETAKNSPYSRFTWRLAFASAKYFRIAQLGE